MGRGSKDSAGSLQGSKGRLSRKQVEEIQQQAQAQTVAEAEMPTRLISCSSSGGSTPSARTWTHHRESAGTFSSCGCLSKDPARVQRYRNVLSQADESLGADAYELWRKMPTYTPNLTAKAKTRTAFEVYEKAHRGAMRRYMEEQGLTAMYEEIAERQRAVQAKTKRAQLGVVVIGCVGMSLLAFMVLTVLLIIALQSL